MLMACKSPLLPHHRKKTKDSAGSSDDTASMIKGEGYVGAAPGNPHRASTRLKEISVGQGGCVPWHPDPHLDWCFCVVLQCISCFYEFSMSYGVFIQFVCRLFNLMAIQMEDC